MADRMMILYIFAINVILYIMATSSKINGGEWFRK